MSVEASTYTGTDLFYPRVCVLNEVTDATMSASTEAAGYEAVAARGPQTYNGWKPTAVTATLTATFSGSKSINYVAIYVTDPQGCTFRPQTWNGSSYDNKGADVTLTEAGPVLWLIDSESKSRVRINVTGGTGMPIIATMKAGLCTVMPMGMPTGFAPAYLNPQDDMRNVFSEGGQILGSQLISSMAKEDVSIDTVEASWVRTNWPTVRDAMRTEGVFFAWNPDDYPDELVYGGVVGAPRVEYTSNLYMRVAFSLEGPRAS